MRRQVAASHQLILTKHCLRLLRRAKLNSDYWSNYTKNGKGFNGIHYSIYAKNLNEPIGMHEFFTNNQTASQKYSLIVIVNKLGNNKKASETHMSFPEPQQLPQQTLGALLPTSKDNQLQHHLPLSPETHGFDLILRMVSSTNIKFPAFLHFHG